MMGRIAALVEIEWIKLTRQGYFYIALALVMATTAASVASAWHSYDPANRIELFTGQACFVQAFSRGAACGVWLVLVWIAMTISHDAGAGTFRLYLAKPIRRGEFFLAKYLTALSFLLLVVWLALLVAYPASGILFGYGDVLDHSETPPILKMSQTELNGILLSCSVGIIPALLAVCAFGLLCSTLADNAGLTVGAALGGLMALQMLAGLAGEWKPWLFTTYLPAFTFQENPALSPYVVAADFARGFSPTWDGRQWAWAVGCPLVWAGVCLSAAAGLFIRRDFNT